MSLTIALAALLREERKGSSQRLQKTARIMRTLSSKWRQQGSRHEALSSLNMAEQRSGGKASTPSQRGTFCEHDDIKELWFLQHFGRQSWTPPFQKTLLHAQSWRSTLIACSRLITC